MSFYDNMQNLARDLIREFGQPVRLVRETGGSIDPVTGETVAGTVEEYHPHGVMRSYPAQLIDGTLIQQGDRSLTLDSTVQPDTTFRVEIGGKEWAILAVETVSPAGTDLIYRAQVRA